MMQCDSMQCLFQGLVNCLFLPLQCFQVKMFYFFREKPQNLYLKIVIFDFQQWMFLFNQTRGDV